MQGALRVLALLIAPSGELFDVATAGFGESHYLLMDWFDGFFALVI